MRPVGLRYAGILGGNIDDIIMDHCLGGKCVCVCDSDVQLLWHSNGSIGIAKVWFHQMTMVTTRKEQGGKGRPTPFPLPSAARSSDGTGGFYNLVCDLSGPRRLCKSELKCKDAKMEKYITQAAHRVSLQRTERRGQELWSPHRFLETEKDSEIASLPHTPKVILLQSLSPRTPIFELPDFTNGV